MVLALNFDNMFTGIIETTGTIQKISSSGTNKSYWISSSITGELKVDQSIAHNGVCLTVEAIAGDSYKVTAVLETLNKTDLAGWQTGGLVNLERCLQPSGRLDGHFVQGHVDATGTVLDKADMKGSWQFTFQFPKAFSPLIIEKGSIAVNGISLTAFNVTDDTFTVAIIPYTYQLTNLQFLTINSSVNLEFDLLGKYIWKQQKKS